MSSQYITTYGDNPISPLWFGAKPDNEPTSASGNTKAMQAAVHAVYNSGQTIKMPVAGKSRMYMGSLEEIKNNTEVAVVLEGTNPKNCRVKTVGTDEPIIHLGEKEKTTRYAQQDWRGFEMRGIGWETDETPTLIRNGWRYSESIVERNSMEGYERMLDESQWKPKCWGMRLLHNVITHCGTGVVSSDNRLWMYGNKMYWNDKHVEVRGGNSLHFQNDFGPSNVAHIHFVGGRSAANIVVMSYSENGYDRANDPDASVPRYTPIRPSSLSDRHTDIQPAGFILIEDMTVTGLTIIGTSPSLQNAEWAIKIDNPDDKWTDIDWIGGGVRKTSDPKGGYVYEFVNEPPSDDHNIIRHRGVYSSKGMWDDYSNYPDALIEKPIGFSRDSG